MGVNYNRVNWEKPIKHTFKFPGNDVITAIAISIVFGFAATGINQVKKQLA